MIETVEGYLSWTIWSQMNSTKQNNWVFREESYELWQAGDP